MRVLTSSVAEDERRRAPQRVAMQRVRNGHKVILPAKDQWIVPSLGETNRTQCPIDGA
jgi:hypothetical protein